MESTHVVSVEIQAVLNHLAGPKCIVQDIENSTEGKYIRTTWYNSVMYAQDNDGIWHRAYADTSTPMTFQTAE